MRLTILDQISDPGNAGKPNDDSLCAGPGLAAVIDGATGIGDRPVFPEAGSDAAWLAKLASETFSRAHPACDTASLVRDVCRSARTILQARTDISALPRHAWPTASFQMARLADGGIELAGLGDCVAFVLQPDGETTVHSAMPANRGRESAWARTLLDAAGGLDANGEIPRQGAVLERMRKARDRHNTPQGGVWTLGLVEEAALHLARIRLPARDDTSILLMTDGFSALFDAYRKNSPGGAIRAVLSRGLADNLCELRAIEREEDPLAQRFPRFKRCDDATAILCRIGR
jgi:hypothetical protein